MAVAELIVKFQEKDFSALDGIRGDKKFSSLSSFTASKESLQWVREYLSETLFYSRKCAKEQEKSGVLFFMELALTLERTKKSRTQQAF
jgi:predicted RNA-binding protein with EMAP domain